MRTIKFRAWQIPLKRMRKLTELFIGSDHMEIGVAASGKSTILYQGEYELMQFTGLLDKTGKEIYEGDLVRDTDNGLEFEVRNNGISFYAFIPSQSLALDLVKGETCYEVIGNIYENPEMLKD